MDGYALRFADLNGGNGLRVIGRIDAGDPTEISLDPGTCVRIATGAPVPASADTVVRHEWTDRGESEVKIESDRVQAGDCIHRTGADAEADEVLFGPGRRLTPLDLSIAAAVGRTSLLVGSRRPVAGVISSGNEVVPSATPADQLGAHQIRDSNAEFLRHALAHFGAHLETVIHCPDEFNATIDALTTMAARVDVIVTIGGVSAGERDWFPLALERLGAERVLRGAAIQPGKPIMCSKLDRTEADPSWVISLPGNPVSVFATSHLFLWPLVRRLAGETPALPWRHCQLGEAITPNPRRRLFRPCVLEGETVRVPHWQGSGDFSHCSGATGLVEIPEGDEKVEAGTLLRVLPWAWEERASENT